MNIHEAIAFILIILIFMVTFAYMVYVLNKSLEIILSYNTTGTPFNETIKEMANSIKTILEMITRALLTAFILALVFLLIEHIAYKLIYNK